jgi:hypothetical protein
MRSSLGSPTPASTPMPHQFHDRRRAMDKRIKDKHRYRISEFQRNGGFLWTQLFGGGTSVGFTEYRGLKRHACRRPNDGN